jgi:hypothetical protein
VEEEYEAWLEQHKRKRGVAMVVGQRGPRCISLEDEYTMEGEIWQTGWRRGRENHIRRAFSLETRIKEGECLALYCFDYLENIGFVYPAMSMIVIGHLLGLLADFLDSAHAELSHDTHTPPPPNSHLCNCSTPQQI